MSCQRVLEHALPPGDTVERFEHVHFDPAPRVVSEARRFVRAQLPPLPADTVDATLLMASELVTNAVIHARTRLEVGVMVSARAVLVTVHDLDLARAAQQPYSDRDGGRGLGIVATLSEEHAVDRHDGEGKTAWFRVSRQGDVA